ncbi:MAG TPA: YihY/virulence factor BrkB family protein [Pyrinomonadaceae bacterium]
MQFLSFTYEDLKKIPIKDFFSRFFKKAFDEEDLMSVAAQVAFYFAFALFPLLLFLVSVFGIVMGADNELRTEMFYYLHQVMPNSAFDLVQKTVEEVAENSSGGKLTLGLLIALYSASAGLESIRVALNGVYNLTETRAWWKTKLISLGLTFSLALLVTVALGIVFYGSKFLAFVLSSIKLPVESPMLLGILQWVTVGVVLIGIFALIYNYLPKHKKYNWIWITPGAIISIVLWLLLSYGFKLYLGYFDSYDKTYGSLGAVIILMLWLYLTALVILIGGTMNAVLQEFTDPETAEAGAVKAAAKETVENPDGALPADGKADKKAEILESVGGGKPDDQNIKSEKSASDKIPDVSVEKNPPVKKSKWKLIAGILIGFVSSIRKR